MMTASHSRGFALIELVIAMAVLIGLSWGVLTTIERSRSSDEDIRAAGSALQQGANTLQRIITDLRQSGAAEIGGVPRPATHDVSTGSPAVAHREITLATPRDQDGNREPDVVDTRIVWSTDPLEYRVVTSTTGLQLVRRHGAREEVLTDRLVQLRFDTPQSSGYVVPAGCVRVHIELRAVSSDGSTTNRSYESTVRLGHMGSS